MVNENEKFLKLLNKEDLKVDDDALCFKIFHLTEDSSIYDIREAANKLLEEYDDASEFIEEQKIEAYKRKILSFKPEGEVSALDIIGKESKLDEVKKELYEIFDSPDLDESLMDEYAPIKKAIEDLISQAQLELDRIGKDIDVSITGGKKLFHDDKLEGIDDEEPSKDSGAEEALDAAEEALADGEAAFDAASSLALYQAVNGFVEAEKLFAAAVDSFKVAGASDRADSASDRAADAHAMFLKARDAKEALDAAEEALADGEAAFDAASSLALYQAVNGFVEAEKLFAAAVDSFKVAGASDRADSASDRAADARAMVLKARDAEEALDAAEEALADGEAAFDAASSLALYQAVNGFVEAEKLFAAAVDSFKVAGASDRADSASDRAADARAMVLKARDAEEALDAAEEALADGEAAFDAASSLALYQAVNGFVEAEKLFAAAVDSFKVAGASDRADSASDRAADARAMVLKARDAEEALDAAEEALADGEAAFDAASSLALYQAVNGFVEAEKLFAAAVDSFKVAGASDRADSASDRAADARAMVLKARDAEEALDAAEEALADGEAAFDAASSLALYQAVNGFVEAEKLFAAAVDSFKVAGASDRADSASDRAADARAMVLKARDAEDAFDNAQKKEKKAERAENKGDHEVDTEKYEDAEKSYIQSMRLYEDAEQAYNDAQAPEKAESCKDRRAGVEIKLGQILDPIPEPKTKIYINGELIGATDDPEEFTEEMRQKRRAGEISNEMNITYYEDNHEIYIFTDPGRARRPLILVENGESKLTSDILESVESGDIKWDELFELGVLEYLDAEEEENSLIAMDEDHLTPEHTHLEIDPSTMLGICAGIIPFSDHNSSPRNTMEAGMTKQALGLYVSNYAFRTDTRAHLLHHPQVPMVKTRIIDATNYDKRPSGQNLVVALMSYEGYNMEDAMILNKSSLERGMGRSSFFRSYEASERRYPGGQVDKFEVPEKGVKGYRSEDAYEHLDPADGIVSPEKRVESGDVLIGKTSPPRFLEEIDEFGTVGEKRRESSVTVRHGEKGIVDAVLLSETVEGNKLTKIRVRECRQPQFGDKFASRHGQKGVVGLILSQDDIPFTEDGVVPDIIVNPHAIPSRMSVGQVLEMVAGKAGCLEGHRVDGTPFQTNITDEFDPDNDKEYNTVEDLIKDQLFKNGFETAGCESLYNGVTGERIEAEIFVGVAYYQKLHHMTTDKVYARSTGPVQVLTRQPTEGRAREGGLRFGEMERDCLIAHGASLSLLERLLYESDKYEAVVCNDCGMLAVKEKGTNETHCPICGDSETFPIEISYAYKLLLDELKSLCMFPKLVLGDKA